jgi:hypothetical protein
MFGKYLVTSEFQFGFKTKTSCSHAHYSLQKTVDYFVERGSTVNICSIDLSKAFDKLNCYILFKKLMARRCSLKFINILHAWLTVSCTVVKWGACYSKVVVATAGVRQGSILSPMLFSVYVDELLLRLHNSKLGCQIKYVNFNSFMYADDLLLLSISAYDLQKMIDMCEIELSNIDMCVNVNKSSCVRVGPRYNVFATPVHINNKPIKWSNELKYLGVTMLAGKTLCFDFHATKAKYFGSLNSILGKLGSTSAVRILLHLMSTQCSPILTFGLETLQLKKQSVDNLNYVHNAMFSKLFMTFDKTVIEQCHYYTGYLPLYLSLDLKRLKFLSTLSTSAHSPACYLFNWFGKEDFTKIVTKHSLSSVPKLHWESVVWRNFQHKVEAVALN